MLFVASMLTGLLASSAGAAPVPLGAADGFAVLAGTTVTNTGPSLIEGDLGVYPGTAVIGFPPALLTGGTIHGADGVAMQAEVDLTTAYDDAAGRSSTATVFGDLVGATLMPGVYVSATSLGLSGDLTLDGGGDPDAVFVVRTGSTLTFGSGSRVLLIGGAQACNVFWQVGSSATLGASSATVGSILASTSITLATGATLRGRALARSGAVTLDTNTVTRAPCSPTPPPTPPSATDTSATTVSGQPVTIVLHGTDATGAALLYVIVDAPSHGTLGSIDQTAGTVTYTPTAGYDGPDSFGYRVSSSNGTSNTATASITVTPDTPVDTRADLVTSKTVSTTRADGGSLVSYVLTVRNAGPSSASDVELRDPVPADVAIVSTSPGAPTCAVSGQVVTCRPGTLAPGATRTVTINGRATGGPARWSTPGTGDHLLAVGKSEQSEALNAGQTLSRDVTCASGAIATDGSPRVESVDQGTGDVTSVKILEARAVARDTYHFVLRNDATGRAQVHLYVTCLSGTTTGGSGPAHAVVTMAPVTTTSTLAPGRRTITLAVPRDFRAIAPSYSVTSGTVRLVASEPTVDGWALTFDVTTTAVVTAGATPLRSRVAAISGHSHLLRFAHLSKSVAVPAGTTVSTTLSCADDAKGILASFDLPAGVFAVGNEPQPKSRVFGLYNSGAQSVTASVDVDCVSDRTSGSVDDVGVVTNTATATSSTVDSNPADNAASAAFVLDRASAGA